MKQGRKGRQGEANTRSDGREEGVLRMQSGRRVEVKWRHSGGKEWRKAEESERWERDDGENWERQKSKSKNGGKFLEWSEMKAG